VRWETVLPKGAVQGSVEPAGDNHIAYIDADTAAVMKLSRAGSQTLWQLQRGPAAALSDVRILAIE
jgi:hypothetical protein